MRVTSVSSRRICKIPMPQIKSRWSRVERKALVFFPTLNERLSFQRTIPAASLLTRSLVARESSHGLHLLLGLSVCDFSRDMSIYMRVIFGDYPKHVCPRRQTGRTTARSPVTAPLVL